MVGLNRRGRKRTTTNNTEEPRRYPLVTPAQRILQQQMDRPAVPQLPPRAQFQLPQGTVIALLPAKRPKTTAMVAADENRGQPDVESIRSDTVVPSLLSPLGSSTDGEVVRRVEGEGRVKMADPTPTKEAEGANMAHASSTRDAPSGSVSVEQHRAPSTSNKIIVIADVHVSADAVHEQPANNSRQVEVPVGDANRETLSLSQQEDAEKFAEMAEWLRRRSERDAADKRSLALLRQERETLMTRVREIDVELTEKERALEQRAIRQNAFRTLFTG